MHCSTCELYNDARITGRYSQILAIYEDKFSIMTSDTKACVNELACVVIELDIVVGVGFTNVEDAVGVVGADGDCVLSRQTECLHQRLWG